VRSHLQEREELNPQNLSFTRIEKKKGGKEIPALLFEFFFFLISKFNGNNLFE
jgi:hypothetical protein